MLFTQLVQGLLHTRFVGQQIEYHTQLESTNVEARKLIDKGAPRGTLIFTDNQTLGKGREDRSWASSPDKSLTFSVLFYPETSPSSLGWYPLLTGLSVVDALSHIDFPVQLKWPNDILVQQKKLGGILCESQIQGQDIRSLVVGIGLNVNETKGDFAPDLQQSATSMFLASNRFFQREQVLAEILNSLEKRFMAFENEGVASCKSDWLRACAHMNKPVNFHETTTTVRGIFTGLGPKGEARLEIEGKEALYSAGDVN